MEESLRNFAKQFKFEPVVENQEKLKPAGKFIVIGMGGSALSPGLVKLCLPELDILVHKNYGLPDIPEEDLKKSLVILSSYSGNTEEVLDAAKEAARRGLNTCAVTSGGELLKLAQEKKIPFIKFPDLKVQPRAALGLSFLAMLKTMGKEEELKEAKKLETTFKPDDFETKGKELAKVFKGFVPVVYSSQRNAALAYIWKITFNETGKIPAFLNVFPELNHNEMVGFDRKFEFSEKFKFIFLKDPADELKILKRMEVLEGLLRDRGYGVGIVEMPENVRHSVFNSVFSSAALAGWTALYLARGYEIDPEEVPLVEEFKKLIK